MPIGFDNWPHKSIGDMVSSLWNSDTKRSETMSGHNHEMNTRSRANPSEQRPQYSDDINTEMRARIGMLEEDFRKEQHRFKSSQGTVTRVRNDINVLYNNHEDLQLRFQRAQESMEKILDKVILPFARRQGMVINRESGVGLDGVLNSLQHDILQRDGSHHQTGILEQENRTVKGEVKTLHEQVEKANAHINNLRIQVENVQNEAKTFREQVHAHQAHKEVLQAQVKELQKELLASVEETQALPDNQLAQGFRIIVSMVRTLSRTIKVTESVNIHKALEGTHLLKGVSPQHWEGRAGTRMYIEAWLWSALVDFVFQRPFEFLTEHGKGAYEAWKNMFGQEHQHGWPIPSRLCESWRHTTMEQLSRILGQRALSHVKSECTTEEWIAQPRVSTRDFVAWLEVHFQTNFPDSDLSQILPIVEKASALALQMFTQRSRIQITYPQIGATFTANEMSIMPNRDGEDIEEGVVAYVVHPGLTKWGDAHGEKYDHRHDIVRALVQLEPVRIKAEPE